MLELKPQQLAQLVARTLSAAQSLSKALGKINEAIDEPGQIASRLGWDTEKLIYNDLARREFGRLVEMANDRECAATLDSLIKWYTDQLLNWRPRHSNLVSANLEEEMLHRVHQNVLTTLTNFKESQ